MDDAGVLETGEEDFLTTGEKYIPGLEETCAGAAATSEETAEHEDDRGSVTLPLLQHQPQHSWYELRQNHKADTQIPTDGADQKTSVSQEQEFHNTDQLQCSGSVRSQGSDSSAGDECPICSELYDGGDHRVALLNCDHTLCHRCLAGILKLAKDPSRAQCPFCRQNTPLPQREIQRMQEEVYSNSVCQRVPVSVSGLMGLGPDTPVPAPEARTAPASPSCCVALRRQLERHTHRHICGCCLYSSCLVKMLRLIRHHSFCFSLMAILLIFLIVMYMVVHHFMMMLWSAIAAF